MTFVIELRNDDEVECWLGEYLVWTPARWEAVPFSDERSVEAAAAMARLRLARTPDGHGLSVHVAEVDDT